MDTADLKRTGTSSATGLRRAELLGALSLAIDVGLGQPMEHVLRSCLIATRLAETLGLDQPQRATVYFADLLAWIGCQADSHLLATLVGDDIGSRADTYSVDRADPGFAVAVISRLGRGKPLWARSRLVGSFLLTGGTVAAEAIRSHCVSAGLFAQRLGLGRDVQELLPHFFERWDGKGLPAGLRGEELALEMRIVQLADFVEVHHQLGGPAQAVEGARRRRGTRFDPSLVQIFCRDATELLAGLDAGDAWQAAVEAEPAAGAELMEAELDGALEAMADFVDVKSPYTPGHSRGVAALATEAAKQSGLPLADTVELRRAGLLHDLGRMGVSNLIWEKSGPLSSAEWERVRLHPYLTERMLSRPDTLRRLGELAGRHHERLDATGYPHGLPGEALTTAARLLAAADAYHAMLEPRPHRPPLAANDAARELRDEVKAGRLDGEAVDAVLRAAGHRIGRRREWPAGLTSREIEILQLVARGGSSRVIARRLNIAEKTVRNHVEHIYSKTAVSNRTGATLFAIEHGLLGQFPYRADK